MKPGPKLQLGVQLHSCHREILQEAFAQLWLYQISTNYKEGVRKQKIAQENFTLKLM